MLLLERLGSGIQRWAGRLTAGTPNPWFDAPTSIHAALGNTTSSSCLRTAMVCSKIINER